MLSGLAFRQMRQKRIIFVGVREDLHLDPAHPEPLRYRYSVRDALPHLTAVKSVAHGYTREDTLSLQEAGPSLTMTNGASYQQHHVQSESMLPGDASFEVAELTGRVGRQFKREAHKPRRAAQYREFVGSSAAQRFELSGRARCTTLAGILNTAPRYTDRPAPTTTTRAAAAQAAGPVITSTLWTRPSEEVHYRGVAAYLRSRTTSFSPGRTRLRSKSILGTPNRPDDESHRRDEIRDKVLAR